MNIEFKEGQKVYSLAHGWGEVIEINNKDKFPISVRFNFKNEFFTQDGKFYHGCPIILFHSEPEIIVPKWQPKEGEWCLFWDGGESCLLGKFLKIDGQLFISKNGGCFENCAPFVGELPEHLKKI
jgi:hypothetical protein